MSTDAVALARRSYERCLDAAEFFPTFYRGFFRRCPPAERLFAQTDFARQHKLLRHAIGLLFSYAAHPAAEPNVLTRLADRHGLRDLNILPEYYDAFVDALVETAEQCDPEFSTEVGMAWRNAVAPGVGYMMSKS